MAAQQREIAAAVVAHQPLCEGDLVEIIEMGPYCGYRGSLYQKTTGGFWWVRELCDKSCVGPCAWGADQLRKVPEPIKADPEVVARQASLNGEGLVVTKRCRTCKHEGVWFTAEPCKGCACGSLWEPKEES